MFSSEQENRKALERAAEEEVRRTKLYGGADASVGEVYRESSGNLYAEQTEHTASTGITTGEFAMGNPKMGENNTYGRAAYEVSNGKIVLENVRMAENREGLQPEFLQTIANTTNQEVAWDGTTYTPQEDGGRAVRIGMEPQVQQIRKTAIPSQPKAAPVQPLTETEIAALGGF